MASTCRHRQEKKKISAHSSPSHSKVRASLTKTANPTTYSAVGEVIVYSYTITNTGTVPICGPIQIVDDKLGKLEYTTSIRPGASKTFTRTYTITARDLKVDSITNTAVAHIEIKCDRVSTRPASATITNESNRWDYIIVGLGSAGSILARKLTDDLKTRVLVIEAGVNREDDPVVLNPNWLANANTLLYSPAYSINYPVVRGFLSAQAYAEGAGTWGGSSAHNFLIGVRGTPRIYDTWAAITGNPIWSYDNMLPLMKALENYTPNGTILDPTQRGVGGPISLTQGELVTDNAFLQQFTTVSNAPFFDDYNDPPNGNCCVSPVQQLITPPPPNGTRRSYSTIEFLPVGSIIDANGNGLNGRKLKIISNARALRILVNASKTATGVEYVFTGMGATTTPNKVLTAQLKSTGSLILCAGSVQTPKLLLNSGIGPAADLEAVGIPVVVDSPNVGRNLECQYGPGVFVAGGSVPFEAECFIDGSSTGLTGFTGYTGGFNDNVRRMQLINIPLGPTSFQSLLALCNPTSSGSIRIVDPDPLIQPEVNMEFFNGGVNGFDGQTTIVTLKLIKAAAEAAGLAVVAPSPEEYASDEALLAYSSSISNLVIQSHICSTCRMGTSIDNGVIDGNLKVFGLNNVRIADASASPLIVDGNTCLQTYYTGLGLAQILGVPTPPAL